MEENLPQPDSTEAIKTIATSDMEQLYFKDRTDHLVLATGEIFLLTTTGNKDDKD